MKTTTKTKKSPATPARQRTTRPVIVQSGTQGGLSDELFDHPILAAYIAEGGCFGYIGGHGRTVAIDEMVEDALRGVGMTIPEIATFLTWKVGRWLADTIAGLERRPADEIRAKIAAFVAGNNREIREIRAELGAAS